MTTDPREHVLSVFMPEGTAVDDPAMLQKAEELMRRGADQDGLTIQAGPTYLKTMSAKTKMYDASGVLIYDGIPAGLAGYVFAWEAT